MDIIKKIKNYINYRIKNPNSDAFKKLDIYQLNHKSSVIDLGAHDGTISEFFLKKGCKVFAFEPNPNLYSEILKKKKKYKNLECFNLGVNSTSGTFNLYLKEDKITKEIKTDSQASSLLKSKINVSNEKSIQVKCITFENIISITGPVDLVKIDIEGAEYEIYDELLKHSDKFNNCIIELHNKKFPDTIEYKHNDMLKKIKNHKNYKKFNLGYI